MGIKWFHITFLIRLFSLTLLFFFSTEMSLCDTCGDLSVIYIEMYMWVIVYAFLKEQMVLYF